MEIELPADQHDINCQYDEALFALDEKQVRDEVQYSSHLSFHLEDGLELIFIYHYCRITGDL